MLRINKNNKVEGEELHKTIESKLKQFSKWVKKAIYRADLIENKDFVTYKEQSSGGRPKIKYEFTLDAAKEICITENNEKGKQLRRWLIKESDKRQNLDYVTIPEAAFAVKVINALKYVENQKEAYTLHQKSFINENQNMSFVYAEFAKTRSKIIGWNKTDVDNALNEYLKDNIGFNRSKLSKKSMSHKLSVIDISEAIRVSVLDILFSKGTDKEISYKFAEMIKKFTKEMEIEPELKNENTLYKNKEDIIQVTDIKAIK
jgi:anti-repressor protein